MRRGLRAKVGIVALLLSIAVALPALAQSSSEQTVADLNQGAMEAYNNMDINKAGSMLEEALRVAADGGGVSAQLLAQTNLNLAIVYIGGLSDTEGGTKYFVDAICTDPNVQLDPLTSTPDIQSVFQAAQQRVQQSGCPNTGAPNLSPGAAASTMPVGEALTHFSPPEQLTQTPLPLYAEVSSSTGAKTVYLYYKGTGMDQWKRVAMYRYGQGFAYQISCNDVFEPRVQYYIEAVGSSGRVVGAVGSAAEPIEVPVVAARTQAEPALPGAASPASCAASECPPGVKGCGENGTGAIGDRCDEDSECQSGLECDDDDVCMLRGAGGTEVPSSGARGMDDELPPGWGGSGDDGDGDAKNFKRGFFQLGLVVGMTYVRAGMVADRAPPDNRIFIDATQTIQNPDGTRSARFISDPFVETPVSKFRFPGTRIDMPRGGTGPDAGADVGELVETAWVPDADSYDGYLDASGQPVAFGGECAADGIETGPNPAGNPNRFDELVPSRYCVRVKSPGFVPGLALRSALGYFVTEDLSLALLMRFQFAAGQGTLSHMLLGARVEYMFTETKATGLMLSGFLGGTFGQIQAQPPASGDTTGAPWIKSGLQGGHVGMNVRYRLHKNFGFYMSPELDLQFPTFLWHIDLTVAGLEASF